MNTILLFFALPLATIILSIVLQKLLKCPILVAGTFFAIYLVVTYVISSQFLIFAIVYTIMAYITAVIARLICNIRERLNKCENDSGAGNWKNGCRENCYCESSLCKNNFMPRNERIDCCNSNNFNQTKFTVTTNRENPIVYLSSGNNNTKRRNSCCCGRR